MFISFACTRLKRIRNFTPKQAVENACFIEDNLAAHGSSSMIMENALIIDECFVFRKTEGVSRQDAYRSSALGDVEFRQPCLSI